MIDAWDFGEKPWDNCSYAYHIPFGKYGLTTASEPGLAVAADRNPWQTSPAGEPVEQNWTDFNPDIQTFSGTTESALLGNAIAHQGDGQNVLFLDSHVTFEKRAFCSLEDDNIYTISDSTAGTGSSFGVRPVIGRSAVAPKNRKDSVLVHDPEKWGGR